MNTEPNAEPPSPAAADRREPASTATTGQTASTATTGQTATTQHTGAQNTAAQNASEGASASSLPGRTAALTPQKEVANAVGQAEAAPYSAGALSLHLGLMRDYYRIGLNYETPVLWSHDFGNWMGRVDLVVEAGIAGWKARNTGGRQELWQISAIPILRWWVWDPFFIEGGVGPTLINHSSFVGRRLSTAFQFGDHIGVGVAVDEHLRIGMRFAHFSNASIKRPNSGLNIILLTITHDF